MLFAILIDKGKLLELCFRVMLKKFDVLISVLSGRIYELKCRIQNKKSLKCWSWVNTVLPAANKGVFGLSSFRTKSERMIFTLKHHWFRKYFFALSENCKQRGSGVFLIVHWLSHWPYWISVTPICHLSVRSLKI